MKWDRPIYTAALQSSDSIQQQANEWIVVDIMLNNNNSVFICVAMVLR